MWQKFTSYLSSNLIVIGIILFYIFQAIIQIYSNSVVFDEPLHIKSSVEWIRLGTSISDPLSPPLSKFPFAILQLLNLDLLKDPYLVAARFSLVLITSIFLFYFYNFVKNKFSKKVAILSLFFLSIEPAFIAYTHLANTEAITLIFFFLVFSTGIEFITSNPNTKRLSLFLIAICAFYLTKSIFLPAFIFLIIAVILRAKSLLIQNILKSISITVIFFIFTMLILSGFNSYPIFGSHLNIPGGGILNTTFNSISYVTDPAYVNTRQIIFNNTLSHEGSIFYTPISLFIKTSPYLLILSISFIIYYFWKIKHKNPLINQMILLIITTISLVTIGGYNVGIRHLLPLFPFFTILTSLMLMIIIKKFGTKAKALIFGLILITIIFNIFNKDKISYFSPLVGKNVGGNLISESNLDWGQGLPVLKNENIKIDYIASYSPASPSTYGIFATQLPNNLEKDLHKLKGKNIVISKTLYYKSGFFKYDEFKLENGRSVANGTFLLFKL